MSSASATGSAGATVAFAAAAAAADVLGEMLTNNMSRTTSTMASRLLQTTTMMPATTTSTSTFATPTTTTLSSTTVSAAEAIVAATLEAIVATTVAPPPSSDDVAHRSVADAVANSANSVVLRDEWLWTYIGVCCVLGVLLNVIVVWSLLRTKCNGTHYFLLQLSICDIASLLVAAAELHYVQQQRWPFPPETCPLYLGLEAFSSIATVYLLVALNLHTLSTYTLAVQTIRRAERSAFEQQQQQLLLNSEVAEADDDEDGDDDDFSSDDTPRSPGGSSASKTPSSASNQYTAILSDIPLTPTSTSAANDGYEMPIQIVAIPASRKHRRSAPDHTYQKPTSIRKRSLIIDYSQRRRSVSVVLPVLFVWFVAASAATPLFVFGSVLPSRRAPVLCGVVNFDPDNNRLLQAMVLAVRVAIPTTALLLSAVAVALALRAAAGQRLSRLVGLDEAVRPIMRLALVLTGVWAVASAQRVFGSLLFEVWSQRPLMLPKYPRWAPEVALALSMVHWAAAALRPLVYVVCDGAVRAEVARTLCWRGRGAGKRRRKVGGGGVETA